MTQTPHLPSSTANALVQSTLRIVRDEYRAWALRDAANLARSFQGFPKNTTFVEKPAAAASIKDRSWDTTRPLCTFDLDSIVESPLLTYESLQCINRNFAVGDDSSTLDEIPYVDHKDFVQDPMLNYLDTHKRGAWHSMRDPTELVLAAETTRRLLVYHKASFTEIDATQQLFLPVEELIRSLRRRDFPKWPILHDLQTTLRECLTQHLAPSTLDTHQSQITLVCSNPNCAMVFCSTHLEPATMPPERLPDSTPSDLLSARRKVDWRCSQHCYLDLEPDLLNIVPFHLPKNELQSFKTMVGQSPDTLPCDLALMFRRPCAEMYTLWSSIRNLPPEHPKKKTKLPKRKFGRRREFHVPCNHKGPCGEGKSCTCYDLNVFCESRCMCIEEKCNRRWKGCACSAEQGRCCTDKRRCPCMQQGRECNPKLCISCGSGHYAGDTCDNVDMQAQRNKQVVVKQGQWGMGLFAGEFIARHEFIMEYVGELICEASVTSRGILADHRKRAYVFAINKEWSIDSTFMGNPTRFINHSSVLSMINCSALIPMVNGEPRIGFYAFRDIKLGDELFFDYGEDFGMLPGQQLLFSERGGSHTDDEDFKVSDVPTSTPEKGPRTPRMTRTDSRFLCI